MITTADPNQPLDPNPPDDADDDPNDDDDEPDEVAASGVGTPVEPAEPQAKQLTIPQSSMKRIKTQERQKGRLALMTELNAEARSLGYASHEDMVRAMRQKATAPQKSADPKPTAQVPSPQQAGDSARVADLERELGKQTEQLRKANRRVSQLEKENKRLLSQIESKETENQLRLQALRAGVQDVDYAVHIMRSHLKGKTMDQLNGFSEERFFKEDLRRTHPYLYKVEEEPMTTSPASGTPEGKPTAPNTAPAPTDPTDTTMVDATKLSAAEYQELLKKRGFANPMVSSLPGG